MSTEILSNPVVRNAIRGFWEEIKINGTDIRRETHFQGAYPYIPFSNVLYINNLLLFHDVLRRLHPNKKSFRFVDVGCGTGIKSHFAQTLGFDAEGIEIEKSYIKIARKFFPQIKIHEANAITFENYADYDLIYLYCPLRDMNLQKQLDKQILQTMKPGAVILPFYCFREVDPDILKKRHISPVNYRSYVTSHVFVRGKKYEQKIKSILDNVSRELNETQISLLLLKSLLKIRCNNNLEYQESDLLNFLHSFSIGIKILHSFEVFYKKRFLDVGCDIGLRSQFASALHFKSDGIDRNKKYISFAKNMSRMCLFERKDPVKSAIYDLYDLIHLNEKENREEIENLILQQMKKNAVVMETTPFADTKKQVSICKKRSIHRFEWNGFRFLVRTNNLDGVKSCMDPSPMGTNFL